jgi:transketolase|tara:strand:+ start:835 stop:1740 length:906 start_codon:yes stop_codon:yes gene_type:complete
MREALMEELERLAKNDPKIILLTGDHGYALFDSFRKSFPKQYLNVGIAEQNMVGVAAGLCRAGFKPFVYGLSAFIPVRVLEQIKIDVCHDNLPVVFLGDGAGFVYSHLGTSHQSTEDIAITRAIPNISIFSPADQVEMRNSVNLSYKSNSPVYLRIGKSDGESVHKQDVTFAKGDLINIRESSGSIHFIATGSMVKSGLTVADEFKGAGFSSAPSLKPININQVVDICKKNKVIVTLEEHSIYGGLGSLVAEISSQNSPSRILIIGVNDRFSEFCGSHDYLLKEHGLNKESIQRKVLEFVG